MLDPSPAPAVQATGAPAKPLELTDAAARLVSSQVKLALVQLLQIGGPQTSLQLAEQLPGTNRNNVNSHLATLLEDGWICIDAELARGGRRGPRERSFALAAEHDWAGLIAELNSRAARAAAAE